MSASNSIYFSCICFLSALRFSCKHWVECSSIECPWALLWNLKSAQWNALSLSCRRGELVANFVAAEQLWLPPLWQWKDSGDPLPSEERRRVQDPQCWCPHCRPALYGVKSGVLTSRARISNLQSSWKWKLRMQREVCTTCRAAWLLASTQRVRQW